MMIFQRETFDSNSLKVNWKCLSKKTTFWSLFLYQKKSSENLLCYLNRSQSCNIFKKSNWFSVFANILCLQNKIHSLNVENNQFVYPEISFRFLVLSSDAEWCVRQVNNRIWNFKPDLAIQFDSMMMRITRLTAASFQTQTQTNKSYDCTLKKKKKH